VAALFDEHASMVLGLCRLLLRDHHEAEDAAQQTFVSAYRALLRGTEPREPGPWLAAIARNECRARMRKRMRAPVALDGDLELELSDSSDDLAELADRRAELSQLAVEIAKLPSRQREAIALRDFLGLSYEEVASTLKVSVPVVESLLFRARRRLRDSVRTVPRYAAGVVIVPIALRAAVAKDVPEFDAVTVGLGIAGVAGAAAGGIAKLISLPASVKVAATVAVVATGSVVAPQLIQAPGEDAAPRIAAIRGEEREAGTLEAAAATAVDWTKSELPNPPAAASAPAPQPDAPAAAAAAEAPAEPAPAPAEEEELDPDRTSAGVEDGDPIPVPPPPPPTVDPDSECEAADSVSPADDTAVPGEPPAGDCGEDGEAGEADGGTDSGGEAEPPVAGGGAGSEEPAAVPPIVFPPSGIPPDGGSGATSNGNQTVAPDADPAPGGDAPADR
jgi:RNA polymerase sigma-70 factor (ECF subfamily)